MIAVHNECINKNRYLFTRSLRNACMYNLLNGADIVYKTQCKLCLKETNIVMRDGYIGGYKDSVFCWIVIAI